MKKPDHVIEVFLQPGDYYFGGKDTRIRTVLGSCVSITMWHPQKMIGGMCHFMLPSRKRKPGDRLDGRYADEAMAMFMRDIAASGTKSEEYEVKLFGAGNMFPHLKEYSRGVKLNVPDINESGNVSFNNQQAAILLSKRYGLNVHASNLGGDGHRQIFFDLWSGHVWVKHNLIQV